MSMHLWLQLPPGRRADDVAARVLRAGVRVAPGGAFALEQAPAALRISLGAARTIAELETALRRLTPALLG